MSDQTAPATRDDQSGGQEVATVEQNAALDQTPVEGWLSQNGVDVVHLPDGKRQLRFSRDIGNRTNPLVPLSMVIQVSKNYTPVPKLVQLIPEEDTYKQGWDGKAREETHAIRATGLRKIADLMGIEHVSTTWSKPPDTDKGITARVTVKWRGPDGIEQYTTKTKTVRFEQHMEKLRNDAIAKRKKYPPTSGPDKGRTDYTDDELRDLELNEYEHIDAKAETKAWNRCIREVAKISTLPKSAFNKPFLTLSWMFTPDPTDPHALEIVKMQMTQGANALFGEGEEAAQAVAQIGAGAGVPLPPEGHSFVASGELVDDDEDDPLDEEPPIDATVLDDDTWGGGDDAAPQGGIERPAANMTLPKGDFAGHDLDEVASSLVGRAYLTERAKRARKPEAQALMLAWLAWGLQREVTMDTLDAVMAEDSEPAGAA